MRHASPVPKVPEVPQVPDAQIANSAASTLHRLDRAGIMLHVDGDALIAQPADRLTDDLRGLIRQHKPALIWLVDTRQRFAAALKIGRLVVCSRCAHFSARPARKPDGWCAHHGETWAVVPFHCSQHDGERLDAV